MHPSVVISIVLAGLWLMPFTCEACLLPLMPQQQGATFVVNDTADALDANPGDGDCATAAGNNVCTLRAAVQEANALDGLDTIQLPAGEYRLTLEPDDDENGGDLDITSSLIIEGAGALDTVIVGTGTDRVIEIATRSGADPNASNEVAVSGVTIREGSNPVGGGVYVRGDATISLEGLVVTENSADLGGGVYFTGDAGMTIDGATIVGNSARQGAGVFIGQPGPATSTDVTPTLRNSTVSGNQATVVGGGVANAGRLTLSHVTIAQNTAERGAGVYSSGQAWLVNSLVATNEGPDCTVETQPITSLGANLDGDDTCGLTTAQGDLPGTDPMVGPLATNGGSTLTHALLSGSPAIDAADDDLCLALDQRGVQRPQGAACDIGSFEWDGEQATPTEVTPTDTPATATETPSVETPTVGPTETETIEPTPTTQVTDTPGPTETDTPEPTDTVEPTNTPEPTATSTVPPTAVPGQVCDYIVGRVPQSEIAAALANPDDVWGSGMLCYPNVPPSYWNPERTWLSLQNISVPYHPTFNPLVFKCGCP